MRACLLAFIVVLSSNTAYGQLSDFGGTDLTKADSIAELYPGHSLSDLKILSDKLTKPLSSDVEKFRSIYKWVCLNIESDYALFVENKNMRRKLGGEKLLKWEKEFGARVFSIMTAKHRTICTGYAYLVKELAFHAGMNCRIVNGYGRHAKANVGGSGLVNHSWNAIELQGKWYLCDPTWSSGTISSELHAFVKKFDDAYFLAEPSLFFRSHYPTDTQWMLLEEKPSLQTFLNAPLVYIASFRYNVEPVCPLLFNIKTERGCDVSFQFAKRNGQEFSKASLFIENSKTNDAFTKESAASVTTYTTNHNFSHRGKYTVHILLDGSHILSYSVRVD